MTVGWGFGVLVETLPETPTSHTGGPALSPRCALNSSFPLLHTLGDGW